MGIGLSKKERKKKKRIASWNTSLFIYLGYTGNLDKENPTCSSTIIEQ